MTEFHLLATLMLLSVSLTKMAANLPISLVAGLRMQNRPAAPPEKPRLRMLPPVPSIRRLFGRRPRCHRCVVDPPTKFAIPEKQ